MMDRILLVGIGGACGSILRYLLGSFVQTAAGTPFPIGTLIVNVVGCFVIGMLSYLADVRGVLTPELRLLLMVGVLGGFTTFSAFANETMTLARDGATLLALANVGLSVILGLGAVWLGRTLLGLL